MKLNLDFEDEATPGSKMLGIFKHAQVTSPTKDKFMRTFTAFTQDVRSTIIEEMRKLYTKDYQ